MLLVIDMQPGFKTSLQVMKQVTKEVAKAAGAGEDIIFLEYLETWPKGKSFGRTHQEIRDAAKGANVRRCTKKHDDGSKSVLRHLKNVMHLKVCGVNGDACVIATVEGILGKRHDLRVDMLAHAIGWNTCCAKSKFKNGEWDKLPVNIVKR